MLGFPLGLAQPGAVGGHTRRWRGLEVACRHSELRLGCGCAPAQQGEERLERTGDVSRLWIEQVLQFQPVKDCEQEARDRLRINVGREPSSPLLMCDVARSLLPRAAIVRNEPLVCRMVRVDALRSEHKPEPDEPRIGLVALGQIEQPSEEARVDGSLVQAPADLSRTFLEHTEEQLLLGWEVVEQARLGQADLGRSAVVAPRNPSAPNASNATSSTCSRRSTPRRLRRTGFELVMASFLKLESVS